ncbi:aminoglycoside phosphotransferase family protein [Candidatus Uhrbacteria bacterium]|nr:aminoglycoside phosphotransferase family protein [Candidatus Uhrbacteria bacterium]
MAKEIPINSLRKLFQETGLGAANLIHKIDVGFSNDVYSIDDDYILKIGSSEREGAENMRRDIYFCRFLHSKLPTPMIVHAGISQEGRPFMVYKKIVGENLYNKWHLLSEGDRELVIKQICSMLRKINETPYNDYALEFGIDLNISWQNRISLEIQANLQKVEQKGALPQNRIDAVKKYVDANKAVLKEEKIALVYWDVHFDNILIDGTKIVGILDFERVYIAAIDYVLDLVKRMTKYPKKYASEIAENYVKPEDYANLLATYKKYYPELFDFDDLEKRLSLYGVKHSLNDIFYYPDAKEPKDMLDEYLKQ